MVAVGSIADSQHNQYALRSACVYCMSGLGQPRAPDRHITGVAPDRLTLSNSSPSLWAMSSRAKSICFVLFIFFIALSGICGLVAGIGAAVGWFGATASLCCFLSSASD